MGSVRSAPMAKPPNGTTAHWWSDDGSEGYVGHWQDGSLVQDRRMTWLESQGGGSAAVGLVWTVVWGCLVTGVPLGLLYALVRFVKWVWTN